MKPISLLLATNMAIIAMITIFLRVTGLDVTLNENGFSVTGTLLLAILFGFAGSFISLIMSKSTVKRTMKVHIINPKSPRGNNERWLYKTVEKMASELGIKTPEVGIFPSNAPNAFATGASKNKALVAVSQGLLNEFPENEVKAILGHEMAHVVNGDMVTSSLLQGVLNTFVIFLSRAIASLMSRNREGNRNPHGNIMVILILQTVFGFLASLVIMAHSRHREYKADAGGANLTTNKDMIASLSRLKSLTDPRKRTMPDELQAFGIVAFGGLLRTHPPLGKRIRALEEREETISR